MFNLSLAFSSFDGVAIPVAISDSGSFVVTKSFAFDNAAQATGNAPPIAAPVASSVGVPIRPSVSALNLAVSIAPWVAFNQTFVKSHASLPAAQSTPPGVTAASPIPAHVLPTLYVRLFVFAPKDSAPCLSCLLVSSLKN